MSDFLSKDTIIALATAPLVSGVGVIRVSGAQARAVAVKLCPSFQAVKPRFMHYGQFIAVDGELLDKGLIVHFEAPRSFTGEEVVEINCHGGMVVIQRLIAEIIALGEGKIRQAEAGEFSKQAFANGKMDLTEAEALADLIDAETEEQRKQAVRQMSGELGRRFDGWRGEVMHLLAHVEAGIDFPDEELDILADAKVEAKLSEILKNLQDAVASEVGCRLRDGFSVVIIGKPNAGKSTLTNLLTGKDTAIVSEIAGTTRDVIESHLNIGGYPVVLADTAGMRETEDIIEKEGVARAKSKVQESDLAILVVDGTQDIVDGKIKSDLLPLLAEKRGLVVVSHLSELAGFSEGQSVELAKTVVCNGAEFPVIGADLVTSEVSSNEATSELLVVLSGLIEDRFASSRQAANLTRERHRRAVREAIAHLERALELCRKGEMSSEAGLADGTGEISSLLAQDLRDIAASIGKVTGNTGTEDVLDLVFSTFCVGK